MRRLGYPKTPDFRLLVPCCACNLGSHYQAYDVRNCSRPLRSYFGGMGMAAVNGRVVQWVESKASFGDPLNHDIQAKEQYFTYYNRCALAALVQEARSRQLTYL